MAWAGATRQTAITMSRFVRSVFSLKGRDYRRSDAERVSREGTLGWFCRRSRVVAHYRHAITIATQDQLGNVAQEGSDERLIPPSGSFRKCAILARYENLCATPIPFSGPHL